jgi:hypothetical protein
MKKCKNTTKTIVSEGSIEGRKKMKQMGKEKTKERRTRKV